MASPTNLTPADVVAIKAFRIPGWMDRSKITAEDLVDPSTGKTVRVYSPNQPIPKRIRRKDIRQIDGMANLESRIRWVTKGTPLEIVGGLRPDGTRERIFIEIVKAGSMIVRSFTVHSTDPTKNGRKHMSLGGTAKYKLDRQMVESFDPKYWRDEK